jgi:hypothetical protein
MVEASGDFPANKLFMLLRESRWILLIACALYFTVALYGYTPLDPGWSHSVSGALTANPGGMLGAYLADLLFYLFGFCCSGYGQGIAICAPTVFSANVHCGFRPPGLWCCCLPAARSKRSDCIH